MGHMLIDAVRASDDCQLTGALDIAASPVIGTDAGAYAGFRSGVQVTADVRAGLSGSQCLIDFTRPEGTLQHLAMCRQVEGTSRGNGSGRERDIEAAGDGSEGLGYGLRH